MDERTLDFTAELSLLLAEYIELERRKEEIERQAERLIRQLKEA